MLAARLRVAGTVTTRKSRCSACKKFFYSQHEIQRNSSVLDFVLQHYVTVGVEELDTDKLTPLLRLKYHDSIADAVADLGAG